MILRLLLSVAQNRSASASRLLNNPVSCNSRKTSTAQLKCEIRDMNNKDLHSKERKRANIRLCNVSSHVTELLEMHAENPVTHVLFIPGNPGVVSFYKDFVESLYELLGGNASITAIGHVSHTEKNWEHGRLFSLQDQIDHKVNFIEHEFRSTTLPLVLVGHSIGSYITLEVLRRYPEQVVCCIGLYPFLSLNKESLVQSVIGKIAGSQIVCVSLSYIAAMFGLLPNRVLRFLAKTSIGKSWSATAVEVACSYLLQYHTVRNVLFMAMTEFKKLSETPNWTFIRGRSDQLAFLFGINDHWGPLSKFEEISKQAPDVALSIEREGHDHAFSCTEAGSEWVAQHVANLIKNHFSSSPSQRLR